MIDNSSCISAVDTIKSHVADCFDRCSAKGSTFTGTRKLINLDSAISLIPQTVEGGLPLSYTRLEYIKSTGMQYINTKYTPNQNTSVITDVKFNSQPSTTSAVFGTRNTNASASFWVYGHGTADQFVSDYGSVRVRVNAELTDRHDVSLRKDTLIIDDTSSIASESTFDSGYPMYLFAVNTSGSLQYPSSLTLYSCKIFDGVDMVRDFIPCKNALGVVGLYDLVNDEFYTNAGTGEFIGGDEFGTNVSGASFSGFGVTWAEFPEESFTIDFGAYGTGWTALSCYSNSKDGHFNIIKISSSMCIISSAYFVDLESAWDDNYGIYPMARGTYRASYSISGNSITFTNAEYDGTGNGITNYDDFRDLPIQVSNEVNDYYINSYKLDRITVVY